MSQRSAWHATNLDVLRAAAVSIVLVYHLLATLKVGDGELVGNIGHFGVVLFFVHTSCVLMASLQALDPESPRWVWRFYVRRIFRIYPLAIAVVLLALVTRAPWALWMGPNPEVISGRMVLANVMLAQNVFREPVISAPMWSLPLEVEMYVVLPAVFLMIRRPRWVWPMAGLWAMWLAYAWVRKADFGSTGGGILYVPCFLAGAIAYRVRAKVPKLPSWVWPLLLATVIYANGQEVSAIPVWASCLSIALIYANTRDIRPNWFTRACEMVAKYSYGVYLLHAFAIWVAFGLLPDMPAPAKVLLALGLTAGASIAAYHLLEEPMIEIGKRLAGSLQVAGPARSALAERSAGQ